MTLLLTCVTERFVVQASDRRLTRLNGEVHEEIANKATILCRYATFAYTGLSQCSRTEQTDKLMLRILSKRDMPMSLLLKSLAKEASDGMRNLNLAVPSQQRPQVRRTSFVGTGFASLKNPSRIGRMATPDGLHPFIAVVSNAQGLDEEWRDVADRDFAVNIELLPEEKSFLLHAAGQPFRGSDRVKLERGIRRALWRVDHPESIARLLARAIRDFSAKNKRVGPNVMCTLIRRDEVLSNSGRLRSGTIPLVREVLAEANYFRYTVGTPEPVAWIYSPADIGGYPYFGPNYACNGLEFWGAEFAPGS